MIEVLYSAVTPCYCGMIGLESALKPAANGRYLLCKSDTILPLKSTVRKRIYPSVSKVQAGSFRVSVIHRTVTWSTGSSTCVRGHSCECVYTRGLGWAHQQRISTTFLTRKNSQICLVLLTGLELGSLISYSIASHALPGEPSRHARSNTSGAVTVTM